MSGFSFRRQHPIGKYVVDFYCAALNLVIELDGGQHNEPRHQDRDAHRTMWLKAKGVTVLRFWNNDVMGNIEGIWDEIARHAAELGARPATPSLTLPLSGGGNYPGEVDR